MDLSNLFLQLAIGLSFPENPNFDDALDFKLRAGSDTAYVWANHNDRKQLMHTQTIGSAREFGFGIGTRAGNFFAEAGIGRLNHDNKYIVEQEVIYHTLTSEFGTPPFLSDGNYYALNYRYSSDRAFVAQLGYSHSITDRLGVEVSYKWFRPKERYRMWNPMIEPNPVEGDLHACGCLWQGNDRLNLDGVNITFTMQVW